MSFFTQPDPIETVKSTIWRQITFENRTAEVYRLHSRHPDRIPIIIYPNPHNPHLKEIKQHKYLVPKDHTVGQLVYIVMRKINGSPENTYFFYTKHQTLLSTAQLISQVYEQYHDDDGFLYIVYDGENTFG